MFRLQALASRGRPWTPANGSDLPPEQKAAGSNPAGGTSVSADQSMFSEITESGWLSGGDPVLAGQQYVIGP
jgi:hypothetical protein